ncbi:MAG: peptidyl-prolyl cis-trans isomerase [Lachnospiraceae bacterium]|nr:peptidyl-prolyl cis-trans isomerase [Lachnospiraceae bacterium]
MKQKMKKLVMLAAAGLLLFATMTGCGRNIDVNAVVSTVDGEEIHLGLANFFARFNQAQYESFYAGMMGLDPDVMWGQQLMGDEPYEVMVKESILESLQDMILMRQHAGDFDVSITDADRTAITAAAERFIAENTQGDLDVISGQQGIVEAFLELFTIQQRMDVAMRAGVDEAVSDTEAAQKAMDFVFVPFMVAAEDGSSMMMSEDEMADLTADVKAAFAAGDGDVAAALESVADDFEAEVQSMTFDADSVSPDMDFIAAADALSAVGETTDVIETANGLYIGVLTSLLDREATDERKENIVESRRQEQFTDLLEGWREAAEITVNENQWARVSFERQGVAFRQPEPETEEELGIEEVEAPPNDSEYDEAGEPGE